MVFHRSVSKLEFLFFILKWKSLASSCNFLVLLKTIQFADNAFSRPVSSRSRMRFKAANCKSTRPTVNSWSISLVLGPDKTPLSLALACSAALGATLKSRGYTRLYISRAANTSYRLDYCSSLFTASYVVQNCSIVMLSMMLSMCANKVFFALR